MVAGSGTALAVMVMLTAANSPEPVVGTSWNMMRADFARSGEVRLALRNLLETGTDSQKGAVAWALRDCGVKEDLPLLEKLAENSFNEVVWRPAMAAVRAIKKRGK